MLAITAMCVAALVGAGLSSHNDPDLAGRAALARLSGEVVSGVAGEWERLRREPELIESNESWSVNAAPKRQETLLLVSTEPSVVAEALLIESKRLEHAEGDASGALEIMLQLFEKKPDIAQRAAARLRTIQLAVRVGRTETVRKQWQLARVELSAHERLGDASVLLLCALAAGPELSIEERASTRELLITHWKTGDLALPPADERESPLREAYRKRLHDLLPEAGIDSRLEQNALMESARRIANRAGREVSPAEDRGWSALTTDTQELLYRLSEEGSVEGRFMPQGTLAVLITESVKSAGLLPDEFAIDFAGTNEAAGEVVRQRIELTHGAPSFVLRHANPDAVISAVGERQEMLRAALFALALAVAGAGFSVFRALKRERYLGELKSSFVANVSHELRTPVSSILLMAENLENGRVVDEATRNRYHKLIRREADRLRRLVNDVLDFSRIERGKGVHLSMSEVHVEGFAAELEAEARERVTSSNGEFTFTSNGVPGSLFADEDALRRATFNLVENALRHSGSTRVELELTGTEHGGLKIRVRDHGCGVPAARLESLFAPFERLEVSLGDAGGSAGTGLGLAIVREIAEGHGGSAKAHIPDGAGLAFEICVPGNPTHETMETT